MEKEVDWEEAGGSDEKKRPLFSQTPFPMLVDSWVNLATAMNDINLSMGHNMLYPFTLSDRVREKLRFVHQVVMAAGD